MNNANDPALPCNVELYSDDGFEGNILQHFGLTKREHFAGLAMQGIMSSTREGQVWSMTGVSQTAIQLAEVLLEELEK